jgi:hypothetical protein
VLVSIFSRGTLFSVFWELRLGFSFRLLSPICCFTWGLDMVGHSAVIGVCLAKCEQGPSKPSLSVLRYLQLLLVCLVSPWLFTLLTLYRHHICSYQICS